MIPKEIDLAVRRKIEEYKSISQIAFELDFSVYKLYKAGYKAKFSDIKPGFNIDHHCFDFLSTNARYWLGFLYADGNIQGNEINLALANQDKDHLNKFRNFVGSNHKLQEYMNYCKLSFSSPVISQRLKYFNIIENKTHTTEPHLELKYCPHFWRGVVDGDGSINISKGVSLTGNLKTISAFKIFMESDKEIKPNKKSFYVYISNPAVDKLLYNKGFAQLERKASYV